MATQNAINNEVTLPVVVADGGTGATSLTDHAVLVGSGTAAITALTVGATGELLVGATGADPAFSTSADGAFTFTSATAAVDRILTVSNTDNSNAASAATLQLTTGGSSAGDAAIKWTVTGTTNYSMGIDNSDSDKLVISNSTTLGTTNSWVMTADGERTMPLQPAFLAYNSANDDNVTGDGTAYTVDFDTEVFDQNSDFSADTFTAPVTGRYVFQTGVWCNSIAAGHTSGSISIVTTNGTYTCDVCNPYAMGKTTFFASTFCDMTAGDTAYVSITISNSTKVIDIVGGAGTQKYTYFCGYLAV